MSSQASEKQETFTDDTASAGITTRPNASSDIEQNTSRSEDASPEEKDSNGAEVEWDGPDDPRNPLNWPIHKRAMQIICVALMTLLRSVAPLRSPLL